MRTLLLAVTHLVALGVGFALGIYLLPILSAPPAPTIAEVQSQTGEVKYTTRFVRDLAGSDLLHWGEGEVSIGPTAITLTGRIAPGPAYKLYLTPRFVETEEAFLALKADSLPVGDVKTFENFVVPVPPGADIEAYRAVVIWCESFAQFITAAAYRE